MFQGRLRPFFLYLFFPSFLLPDRDSDIDTSHTPFAGSSSDSIFHDAAYMVVKRYIVLAASTPNSRYTFSPDVLPAHLPERERSCVGGRTGLSCFRVRCGLFRLDFFRDRFLFEVAISFFVAKLVCRRARPDGLDQWRIAQIFLYRACGLGLRLQNKEYLCAILGAALYCTYFLCTVKLIY